jgi:hypothetical protein
VSAAIIYLLGSSLAIIIFLLEIVSLKNVIISATSGIFGWSKKKAATTNAAGQKSHTAN